MLRFKEFLVEAFLIEGKIDDLKAQNPGLHHEIDQYAAADTSATKKFVPWLVSQHKKDNVSPDHPDLHQTIQNFDRYKNLHGIKDHSSRSFQEVRDAVVPLIGKGATKAEIAHDGREKIHDSGDVQAYHIKNKEASQKFYGGGPEAGPANTTWCVSARSKDCLYGQYGPMYTIHSKGDPNSPYAVHPERNKITNRHNDGDRDIDQEIKSKPEIAKLKSAIDSIQKHHDPVAYRLKNANDISDKEIDDTMIGPNRDHRAALESNANSDIALQVLHHPNANAMTTMSVARYSGFTSAMEALNHPAMTTSTTRMAVRNENPLVALAGINHQKASHMTTIDAVQHPDVRVALAAINHPLADQETLEHAVKHGDPNVVLAALQHRDVSPSIVTRAAEHKNSEVARAVLNHPLASGFAINTLAMHQDPKIALAALKHKDVGEHTIKVAAMHPDAQVVLAALKHPLADEYTAIHAAKHPDPKVALAAINHPMAETATTWLAAEHPDPNVAMAAINHYAATAKTYKNARYHPDQRVRAAAEEQLKELE